MIVVGRVALLSFAGGAANVAATGAGSSATSGTVTGVVEHPATGAGSSATSGTLIGEEPTPVAFGPVYLYREPGTLTYYEPTILVWSNN